MSRLGALHHRMTSCLVYARNNGFVASFAGLSRKVVSSTCQTESWVTPAFINHVVLRDPNMRAQAIEEDSFGQSPCEGSPARLIVSSAFGSGFSLQLDVSLVGKGRFMRSATNDAGACRKCKCGSLIN